MSTENGAIKVTVLLEHHEGDKRWSASVPLIENCLAEGVTPEEAAKAVIPEIEYFTEHDPSLLEDLKEKPDFLLTEVDVKLTEAQEVPTPDLNLRQI